MKKLEDFENQKTKLSQITGGVRKKTSYTGWENDCQYAYTDSYDDRNNNGIWDSNEWGEYVVSKKLVCCD